MSTRPAPCSVRFRYKIAGLKDLAFELQVPADPAFRPIAAEAAGKYGESVGLGGDEAGALEVSLQETVDLAAGTAEGTPISVEVRRAGDRLEVTISGGGEPSTLSRALTPGERP